MSGYVVCGLTIDEIWPDREPTADLVEFEPRIIGRLSAPLSALMAGSNIVHAAPLLRARVHFGDFVYPAKRSLCGVEGWGEAHGDVSCRRCLRIMGEL